MKSDLEKLEDGTIKLIITIPWAEVKKTWEEIVEKLVKNATVSGFRKGKAPKKIVEEKINEGNKKEEVKEEVLKRLLPKFYLQAVKEHNLKPIINPKIHIDPDQIGVEKLENEADWQFTALTCEVPQIDLGKYKQNIQGVTAKGKIVVPGKESQPPKLEEIVAVLLESVSLVIPKILLDGEVERLLAQTLDEIKKLGLTLDQYLASTHRTPDDLRAEYAKKAENDIKLEFTLQKIAEAEKIMVEEKEIEEAILKAKDEEERKSLESNRYLLASILRQQKTLDFIKNL